MTEELIRQFEAGEPVMVAFTSPDGAARWIWSRAHRSTDKEPDDRPRFEFDLPGRGPVAITPEDRFTVMRLEPGGPGVPTGEWRVETMLQVARGAGLAMFLPATADLRCRGTEWRIQFTFALDGQGHHVCQRFAVDSPPGGALSAKALTSINVERLIARAFEVAAGVDITVSGGQLVAAERVRPIQRSIRGKRPRASATVCQEVAAAIRKARLEGGAPDDVAVAERVDGQFAITGDVTAARYLIRKCREDGYLADLPLRRRRKRP